METNFDIIVIGAGSAGLTVAIGASQIGASVLLIEKEKIGGDCTHYGCVPSKALINYAKEVAIIKKFNPNFQISTKEILEKVKSKIDKVYFQESPKEIEKYGIKVVIGSAKFISKNSISVNGKKISAKKIVIATGGRARIQQIKGIENIKVSTNKEIFIPKIFKSLIIIGAGPIGCELSNAFFNLGVDVTLIVRSNKIMGKEDVGASNLVEEEFLKKGIKILKNQNILRIFQRMDKKQIFIENSITKKKRTIEGDEILISIGRIPNTES